MCLCVYLCVCVSVCPSRAPERPEAGTLGPNSTSGLREDDAQSDESERRGVRGVVSSTAQMVIHGATSGVGPVGGWGRCKDMTGS